MKCDKGLLYNAAGNHEEVCRTDYEYTPDKLLGQMEDKVRLSPEEKEKYIKKFGLNKGHPVQKMFALFLAMAALRGLQIPMEVIAPTPLRRIGGVFLGIFLFLVFAAGSAAVFHLSNEDKKEYRYLKTRDIYRVRVFYCDKARDEDGTYIRISDGKGNTFDGYYYVSSRQWKNAETIAWYVYYYRQRDEKLKIRIVGEAL